MECQDVRDRLSGYLEGELPAAEGAFVRDHLAACTVCRGELEGLKKALAALHDLDEAPAPEAGAEEALRKVRERKKETARPRRRAWIGPGWAWGVPVQAAAMVAIVFLALYLTRNPAHSPETGSLTMAQRESAALREEAPEKRRERAGAGERPAGTDRVASVPSPKEPAEVGVREKAERKKAPAASLGTAKKEVPPKAEAPVVESARPAEEAVSVMKKEQAQEEAASTAPTAKAAAPAPPVAAGEGGREEVAGRRVVLERSLRPVPEKDLRDEGNRLPPVASAPATLPPASSAAPSSAVEPVREWVVKSNDLPAAAARLRTVLAELGGEVLEDDGRTILARLPGTRMGRLEEALNEGWEVDRPAGPTAGPGRAEGAGPAQNLSGRVQRDGERQKGLLIPAPPKEVQGQDRIRVRIRLVAKENR